MAPPVGVLLEGLGVVKYVIREKIFGFLHGVITAQFRRGARIRTRRKS